MFNNLAIMEIQISTSLMLYLAHSKYPRSINQMTVHAGEVEGKAEHLFVTNRSINWDSHFRNNVYVLTKAENQSGILL